MNSYTSFLKANGSQLPALHRIRTQSLSRIAVCRQSLPQLFAREFAKVIGQSVVVRADGNTSDKPACPRAVVWQLVSLDQPADVRIAPLGERLRDLSALLGYFFKALPLTQVEQSFLRRASWPGDVMQIYHVAAAKRLRPERDVRDLHAIPEDELALSLFYWSDELGVLSGLIQERGLKGTTDMIANRIIEDHLEACGGRVSDVARLLRLRPTTLYSRRTHQRQHAHSGPANQSSAA